MSHKGSKKNKVSDAVNPAVFMMTKSHSINSLTGEHMNTTSVRIGKNGHVKGMNMVVKDGKGAIQLVNDDNRYSVSEKDMNVITRLKEPITLFEAIEMLKHKKSKSSSSKSSSPKTDSPKSKSKSHKKSHKMSGGS